MGTGRHGSRFDSRGHFGFVWRQEISELAKGLGTGIKEFKKATRK